MLYNFIDTVEPVIISFLMQNLTFIISPTFFDALLHKYFELIGHVLIPECIKLNPKKVLAIQSFPIPIIVKAIQSFLDLLGYYRRFIKRFVI